jgi:heat shock protein HslJ
MSIKIIHRLLLCAAALSLVACAIPPEAAKRAMPKFDNTNWELMRWEQAGELKSLPHGDNGGPISLTFNHIDDQQRVSGHAGCNRYNSSYSTANGKLSIAPIASTRMACEPGRMQLESAYLQALTTIASTSTQDQELTLTTTAGDKLVFYSREYVDAAIGKTKFIYVDSQLARCMGVAPMECYRVREREDQPWQLWYSGIEGFKFEPGISYRLRIIEVPVKNVPADASSLRWILDLVVEQRVDK